MAGQPEVVVAGQIERGLTRPAWLEAPSQTRRFPLGGSLRKPAERA
jgi:hypothetical protein